MIANSHFLVNLCSVCFLMSMHMINALCSHPRYHHTREEIFHGTGMPAVYKHNGFTIDCFQPLLSVNTVWTDAQTYAGRTYELTTVLHRSFLIRLV